MTDKETLSVTIHKKAPQTWENETKVSQSFNSDPSLVQRIIQIVRMQQCRNREIYERIPEKGEILYNMEDLEENCRMNR